MLQPRRFLLLILPVALLLGVGFLTVQSPALVLWQPIRPLVMESDDWGEDAAMVAGVCRIMANHIGADGLPAVFQPNYVLSSLSYEQEDGAEVWKRYDLPALPPMYSRPGMWPQVFQGMADGLWYPELHAIWHYDPQQRLDRGLSSELARRLTRQGVSLFPGSEAAREFGLARSLDVLTRDLDTGLVVFERLFGRPPASIIAPDYVWYGALERLWLSRDLACIQAKREQRNPKLPPGKLGRGLKFVDRQLARILNRDRVYLERNCRLEPVQSPDPVGVVTRCVADAVKAWEQGQPAIVEVHRVNLAHTDPEVVRLGQRSLEDFLTRLAAIGPAPTYLSDTEVAQLQTRGVSAVRRGRNLVLRNGTHSRRLVMAPAGVAGETRLFALEAESVHVVPWGPDGNSGGIGTVCQ